MRRHFPLLLIALILAFAAARFAVEAESLAEDPAVIVTFSTNMVSSEWQPVALEPVDSEQLPLVPDAPPGAQFCAEATTLQFPDGSQMVVNGIDEEEIDPILGCAYGTPPGPRDGQGYRTVWYQFTAPDNGYVTIETVRNADYRQNYDTIVAIYAGNDCGDLTQQLACDDDNDGFLSRAQTQVIAGQVYLVEVADWQFGIDSTKVLSLRSTFSLPDSRWEQVHQLDKPRSRHASVLLGDELYLISGQSVVGGEPARDPEVLRYNLTTGTSVPLAPLRGPDGAGYANTSASHLSGRIYLPSGYVGDEDNFDGTHWVYDIATDRWNCSDAGNSFCDPDDTALPAPRELPWPDGQAFGYVSTVAFPPFGVYYAIGGVTGPAFQLGAEPRAEMYSFQPSSSGGVWLTLPPMGTARYAHTAARLRNKICVAGGVGESSGQPIILTNGECYDTITRIWAPTGALNVPRYNAGSAVGPDGRWYVFGGTDAAGASVSNIEVYDPFTNVWSALDASFDVRNPPRAWARGGFLGSTLWIAGGHLNTAGGDQVVNLVDRLFVPQAIAATDRLYFPAFLSTVDSVFLDNTMARALPLGTNVLTLGRFRYADDYFDFYYYDLFPGGDMVVRLESIEVGANYDVIIYDANKIRVGAGQQIANLNEYVELANLPAGRYYMQVVRDLGLATLDYYHIKIER